MSKAKCQTLTKYNCSHYQQIFKLCLGLRLLEQPQHYLLVSFIKQSIDSLVRMMQVQLKKRQLKAAGLVIIHGIIGLFCLISFFTALGNWCSATFYFYFLVYSIGGLCQTALQYRIPKMNLFDKAKCQRVKLALAVLLLPVAIHFFFSIMWWAKWPQNPLYCMFCIQLKLPYLFGLPLAIHAFAGFVFYVEVGHAYTKRKYFLICIGGPQNEIIRDQITGNVVNLTIPIVPALGQNHGDVQYEHFEDRHQGLPEIHQQIYAGGQGQANECSICLNPFSQNQKVGKVTCNHIFHIDCIRQWMLTKAGASRCPVCRAQVL